MNSTAAAPDWSSIDTVLLDMDGTLLDLGFDIHFWQVWVPRQYAASRRLSIAEARQLMKPIFEATHGTLDWYCIDYWSRALSLDIAALKRAARHQIAWLPRAREFLAGLRATGRRVVLVTNAHPETLAIKDAHLGVRREFHAVYSSHDLGEAKESAAFWPRLAAQERFDASRTLCVDDSLPVLRAARAHGIAWLFAIRRPDSRFPSRVVEDFPGVDSVHELAQGLAPRSPERQPAGGA
ncbi:MAG: GMP/IMP nucleotidase [Gammaproteobacteria bacterium]|nr:GMP/IMP nucleotidase [Gammaproteobacteria bacterium]